MKSPKQKKLICLLGASRDLASHTVLPESGGGAKMTGICGASASEPYGQYDPNTHSLRTYQACLPLMAGDSSTECLRTWLPVGTMRSGKLYQRVPLVRHTHGNGCGYWPTPRASFGMAVRFTKYAVSRIGKRRRNLENQILQRATNPLEYVGMGVSPTFVEWLMGYPIGWTDCEY